MTKKTKIRLGLGILIFFLCIAIACLVLIRKQRSQDSQNGQTTVSATETASQAVSATVSAKAGVSSTAAKSQTAVEGLYTNSGYGFSLTFTSEWNGYNASAGEKKDITGFVGSVEFKLPNITEVPLTVYIFDKQSNESVLSQVHATKISTGDKYLYGYSTWENSPSSIQITDKSIANLITTFKLI